MCKTLTGYAPAAGYLAARLADMAQHHPSMPHYTLKEYSPLLDSSSLQPQLWNEIVGDIALNYPNYDGFVVIHGTDTLVYTASALSFMLSNLGKPVIITGSMIPLVETPNDAEQNLLDALSWACQENLYEVCVAFNRELLRGNRARKIASADFAAFCSPNYPVLGHIKSTPQLNSALCLPPPKKDFYAYRINAELAIAGIKLFPGYTYRVIEQWLFKQKLAAVVLETYGSGNAPENDTALLAAFKYAHRQGTIIVNCSQCLSGKVSMGDYTASHALLNLGLISAYDMTSEAALSKLYVLLSQSSLDLIHVAEKLSLAWCGEITVQ